MRSERSRRYDARHVNVIIMKREFVIPAGGPARDIEFLFSRNKPASWKLNRPAQTVIVENAMGKEATTINSTYLCESLLSSAARREAMARDTRLLTTIESAFETSMSLLISSSIYFVLLISPCFSLCSSPSPVRHSHSFLVAFELTRHFDPNMIKLDKMCKN